MSVHTKYSFVYKEGRIGDGDFLILSPYFYWIKREKLNLSLREVKQIAPSLFEGVIPDGDYKYIIEKIEEDEYILIAYSVKDILDKLEKLGIKKFKKVSFSQFAFDIDANITIKKELFLIKEQEIWLESPIIIDNSKKNLNIEEALNTISKVKTISLEKLTIDNSTFFSIAVVLVFFILIYLYNLYQYKKELDNLFQSKENLIKAHSLPPTEFQLNSLIKELKNIQHNQFKIRNISKYIFSMKTKQNESIKKINFTNKKVYLEIITSKDRINYFKNFLNKKFRILESKFEDKILTIRLSYE